MLTVGYGVNVSGNVGYGEGKADSSWVGEQTSIVGHSEVDIYVEDDTHLKGSIIATDKGGDLTLNTGTLTYEVIHDSNKSSDWHAGISGGFNISGGGFDKPANAETPSGSTLDKFLNPTPIDYTTPTDKDGKPKPGGIGSYLPDSTELTYASSEKEGVLRPTVTEGTIIVRDDPDVDLSGLNRDIDKAREITKDEEKYVDAYISPAAIAEVLSGFESIRGQIDAYDKVVEALMEELGLTEEQAAIITVLWTFSFSSKDDDEAALKELAEYSDKSVDELKTIINGIDEDKKLLVLGLNLGLIHK